MPCFQKYSHSVKLNTNVSAAVEVRSRSPGPVASCVDSRWNKDETINNLRDPPGGGAVCSLTSQRADACRKSTSAEPFKGSNHRRHSDANCVSLVRAACHLCLVVEQQMSWIARVLEKKKVSMWKRKKKWMCVCRWQQVFNKEGNVLKWDTERKKQWNEKVASHRLHSFEWFYLKLNPLRTPCLLGCLQILSAYWTAAETFFFVCLFF